MLIPTWLYTGLVYGLLGAGGLALIYYAYRPKSERRSKLERWLPLAMLFGGPAGAWGLNHVAHDAVVVRDADAGAEAIHRTSLGEPSMERVRDSDSDLTGYDQLYILNESAVDVRIEHQLYGHGFGQSEPQVIPAGKALRTYALDYVGPDDRPPESLEVQGVEAIGTATVRSWLTWDRR